MINEIKQDAQERMKKTLESLGHAFAKIRTGRAHPSILDGVMVSYYGSDTPLRQIANVVAEDSRTLALTVFDKGMIQAVEKAIMTSDLGLNPATAGTTIRVPMPALTEETRKEMVKQARADKMAYFRSMGVYRKIPRSRATGRVMRDGSGRARRAGLWAMGVE